MTDLEHTIKVVASEVDYLRGEAHAPTVRIVTGRLNAHYTDVLRDIERQEQSLREMRAIADVYRKGLADLGQEVTRAAYWGVENP